jgi:thiamine biosynthesis lipoprotein
VTVASDVSAPQRHEYFQVEMAAPIKLIVYADDQAMAAKAAEAAFARIRQLNDILSDYDPKSELRRLCDTSTPGRPVRVSDDLWTVLSRAQAMSQASEGAFDVSVGPLVRLWRRVRRQAELPSAERLEEARSRVGYRHIRLDAAQRTVELLRPEMRLDLGGIAMGYAIDEAAKILHRHGITCFLIDASGDILLGNPPPGKTGWVIGVMGLDPKSPPLFYLSLANVALTTSGDTEQFVEIDGRRYSHLVDPRTGMALTDHSTVTVVACDAATADALASAVSVLGPDMGLRLVERTPGAAAFILRSPAGKTETYRSSRWKQLRTVAPARSRHTPCAVNPP